jgi:hypothetical protein
MCRVGLANFISLPKICLLITEPECKRLLEESQTDWDWVGVGGDFFLSFAKSFFFLFSGFIFIIYVLQNVFGILFLIHYCFFHC